VRAQKAGTTGNETTFSLEFHVLLGESVVWEEIGSTRLFRVTRGLFLLTLVQTRKLSTPPLASNNIY
jgi:hypothetical protein